MRSPLARTTALAAAAVLVLGGALAFQRPDDQPEVHAAATPDTDSSGTPSPSDAPVEEEPAAPATPYEPEPTSARDLGIERSAPSETTGPAESDPSPAAPETTAAPQRRDGFLVAPGSSATVGDGTLRRFTVEVEEATGLDPQGVAATVESILFDPRSWISTGRFGFQRIEDPAIAHVRVVVATPPTVDRWCASVGLNTGGWLSCQVHDRAMLNVDRWRSGVAAFGGEVDEYRAYLVNHEVGHVLGYRHVDCPGRGALAPVMMQQSKSVGSCVPNGWVAPERSPGD